MPLAASQDEMDTRLRELRDGTVELTGQQRQTRERLLTVAADHFARFGYRKASVGAIADDAGLGKGTVYLHFDSKKTLLVACIADEKLRMVPEVEAMNALEGPERLEAFLRTAVSFSMTAPLSRAILRGDRELETILADMDPDKMAADEARTNSCMLDLVRSTTSGLGDSEVQDLANIIRLASILPAHLPEAAIPMPVDQFVDSYARLLTRGVEASTSDSPTQPASSAPTVKKSTEQVSEQVSKK